MITKIEIKHLNKIFTRNKENLEVLKDINLSLCENQFVSLLGPSGCGKSTILRILAGLENNFSGDIKVCGKICLILQPNFAICPKRIC